MLFRAGDVGDRFYLVKEGAVLLTKAGEPTMKLTEGSYFGEQAIIKDITQCVTMNSALGPRPATKYTLMHSGRAFVWPAERWMRGQKRTSCATR